MKLLFFCIFTVYTETNYSFQNSRRRLNDEQIRNILEDIPSDESLTDTESDSSNEDITIGDFHQEEEQNLVEGDDSFSEESENPTKSDWVPKWRKKIYFCNSLPVFNEYCGPNKEVYDDDREISPIDIFRDFIDKQILDSIAFQTNLYSTQQGKAYKPTNAREIEIFIGINFLMALKKQPSYRDYWSTDSFYTDHAISNAMSFNRFSWLLSHIHINDNSTAKPRNDPEFDKLHKVRPFLDHLQNKFKSLYFPKQHQSIDESMIKFKGRSSIKQYMPMKPIKRGYKVWVRADDNGYVCEFSVYTGKNNNKSVEHGLGESVVHSLSDCLASKGYKIYADNFFSSFSLAKSLSEKGIGYVGTIRKNRKHFPDFLDDKKLKRGDSDYRMDESGVSCVKWMDTKSVNFVANFHDPSQETCISRKNKDGSTTVLSAPSVAGDYRKFMGGVDKADMLKSIYEINRKSRRWWLRIFFHFLDVCVVNASIIQKCLKPSEKMTLKDFKKGVIAGLIASSGIRKRSLQVQDMPSTSTKRQKTRVSVEVRRDKSDHLPHLGGRMLRCNHCSTKKEPHRTKWVCSVCNVGLCNSTKRNCFTLYHK